jgi:hypothetical protein
MARIKNIVTYNYDLEPSLTDYLIGTDTEDSRRTKNYKIGNILSLADTFSSQDGILTGGVSWLQDLVFEVTPLTYIINTAFYSSLSTEVTLATADPTNPRIDLIVVDRNGLVSAITGTPSATPVKPSLDNIDEVEITFVQVDALATTPSGVTEDLVYNEDVGPAVEWTATENTSGTIIDLADTTDPYSGTVSVSWTDPGLIGNTATFVSPSTLNVVDFTTLHFYIKLQSAWTLSGAGIIVQLFEGATEVTGAFTIISSQFGITDTDVTNYQSVVLALEKLHYLGTTFDTITIELVNIEDGLFLDYVRVLGGVNNPAEFGSFLSLSDVEDNTYVGKAGFVPVVNSIEKGLGYFDPTTVVGTVHSVFGRVGDITAILSDYSSFFVELAGDTMTGDLIVPDEAYGVAWDANLEVPTKNAIYDKIESLVTGVSSFNSRVGAVVPTAGDYDAFYFTEAESDARYVEITGDTMTGDLIVPDEAYGVAWDANLEVPTKNAIYDKIEALVLGVSSFNSRTGAVVPLIGDYDSFFVELSGDTMTGDLIVPDEGYGIGWLSSLEVPTKNSVYIEMETKLDVTTAATTYVAVAGDTMTGDLIVPDEAYGVAWDANLEVPTKNAVYDEINSLVTGVSSFNSRVGAVVPTAGDYDAFYFTETESDARYVEITGDTMTGNLTMSKSSPEINIEHTGASADEGKWDIVATGNDFRIRAILDSGSLAGTPLQFARTGGTVSAIELVSTALTHNGDTVWTEGNDGAGSGLDADLFHGLPQAVSGAWWDNGVLGSVATVSSGGVLEIGKYIDFHLTDTSVADNDGRLTLTSANNWTFNGGLICERSIASSFLNEFSNTNTGSGAHTRLRIDTAGSSGGDPFIDFGISGVHDWTIGVDNSDGDALKINRGSSSGPSSGTNVLKITTGSVATFVSTVTATNFILSSDERKKNMLGDYEAKPIDVNWKLFTFKNDESDRVQLGTSAQDLEKRHPEFVITDEDGDKSVAYIDLLIAKNAELEARINKLEQAT